jgi:hypothetical protein
MLTKIRSHLLQKSLPKMFHWLSLAVEQNAEIGTDARECRNDFVEA